MKNQIIEYVYTIDSGARNNVNEPILLDVYGLYGLGTSNEYVWMVSYFFHNTLVPASEHNFCPDWWPAAKSMKELIVELDQGLRSDVVPGVRPSFIVVTAPI